MTLVPRHRFTDVPLSMNLVPKAGASSPHSKRWRAKPVRRNIAKRLECVRLAGAFVGSWSQCANTGRGRFPMNLKIGIHRDAARTWNEPLWSQDGAHGATRPTLLPFKGSRCAILGGNLTPALFLGERFP